MAMPGRRKGSNSVELPPLRPNAQLPPPLLDSTEEGATSTSSSRVRSVSTTSTTTRGSTEGESGISHFSVSTILGLRGVTSSSTHNAHAANATTEKLKGEKARSLLKMLMRNQKLKLPGADPAQAVAYSMFLRVPPPEDRKDYSRHLYQTLNCSDNLINSSMSYSFRIKLFLNELEL